jgi:hypothetical protein
MDKCKCEINPCPFCGNKKPDILLANESYGVICDYCGAFAIKSKFKQSAINQWNFGNIFKGK